MINRERIPTLEEHFGIPQTLRRPDNTSTTLKREHLVAVDPRDLPDFLANPQPGEILVINRDDLREVEPVLVNLGIIDILLLEKPREKLEAKASSIRQLTHALRTPLLAALNHLVSHP